MHGFFVIMFLIYSPNGFLLHIYILFAIALFSICQKYMTVFWRCRFGIQK